MQETIRSDGLTQGITIYGETYIGVNNWRDAQAIAKETVEVSRAIIVPICITRKDWFTGLQRTEKIYNPCEIVYFMNKDNQEVAYWSSLNNAVVILQKPRIWDKTYLENVEDKY